LADLVFVIGSSILAKPIGSINKALIELFGLFLNILIALELLENITVYLKKHIFQVELVISTALVAVARKIIIFDLQKYSGNELIALAVAILALSTSYWLIRQLRGG
ncbi:MAG: phosphate-starvation-inducible PsiE family protein, partial [Cyanobacteria bacterium J06638_38]